MKKFIFFLLFFLTSCSQNLNNKNLEKKFLFDDNLSFDQFKSKLEEYAKYSDYPDIDN